MKINRSVCKKYLFLDIPLLLLGLNYVLYNAFSFDLAKDLLRIVAVSLFVIGWILKGNLILTKKEVFAIFLAVMAVIFNGTLALNFLLIVVFSVCVTFNTNNIISSSLKINGLLVLFMIILMLFNVIDNKGYISSMGRLRYTLGFENPNVAALFYSSAIYLFIVSREKMKYSVAVLAVVCTIVLYYYTNSRTTLMALVAFLILESLNNIMKKRNMRFTRNIFLFSSLYFVDFLFLLNLVSIFSINQFMVFDEVLSFRISTFSRMINNADLGIFLFGGTLKTVDNFYYMLLFQYGIFIYFFVAVLVHSSIKRMIKEENTKYIPLLVGLFLVATMESSLIRPEILVTLVVWKVIFLSKYKQMPHLLVKGD